MTTGDHIRGARQRLGWTQRRLADEVGVSVRAVTNWERGTGIPRGSRLANIEAVLNAQIRPHPTVHVGEELLTRTWRVGRKVERTLYAQLGPQPSDDDILIGMVDTPALAARLVLDHNHALTCAHRPGDEPEPERQL